MTADVAEDDARERALELLRIIAIAVLAHLALVSSRLTVSLYALSNKTSTFTVGVIVAMFSLVPMLIAMPAGRWIDAVGPRRPTLIGVSLMLGGMVLPAAFPYRTADVAPLLVSAGLVGSGCMFAMMSIQQLVGERADPGRRQAAFSWLALGASISGFVGPVASGALIDAIGHRATFAVLVFELVGALALVLACRDLLPSRDGEARPPVARHPLDLLRHTDVRRVMIATSLISMSWDLQTFIIPIHGTHIGLSASQIGLVLGSFALATFAIRLAMPRLARHFGEWDVLTWTMFITALTFALFPFLSTLALLMAVAFVLGLGLGAAQPNIMSLVHSRSPEGRIGEALGLRMSIINSSQVALPLVFGAFGSVLGAGSMFWFMAALVGGGGLFARRWRQPGDQEAVRSATPG